MNWKRILNGKLSINYFPCFRWSEFRIEKYWSGRLIYLHISKISIGLDCRISWLKDMVTGVPE